MDEKIYTSSEFTEQPDEQSEPHQTILQISLEENFAAELVLLQSLKMKPRPEAIEHLLQKINLGTLEEHL